MRIFVTVFAVIALAAAPCAWDSDPREPAPIAALFAGPAALAAARPLQTIPMEETSLATSSALPLTAR